jgi:glycerophosphoryl diester phosphodiesterase
MPFPTRQLSADPCLIIAHRGASYDAPENTLAAINLAWGKGAPAAEIDIHLSSDGQIVVLHDFNTKKLFGRDREVKDQTVAELRELDAGRHKGVKWEGERIPLLDEVLATVPAGRVLVVEIKVGPEIVSELVKSYSRSGLGPDQIIMISLNWESAAAAIKAFPEHRVYPLSSFNKNEETQAWEPSIDELIKRAKDIGANGLSVEASDTVDAAFIAKAKEAGLEAYVWTVDDPAVALNLKRWGIDGITTNRPQWLAKRLER